MTVEVRPALPDDAPEVARINVDAWRTAYRGIVSDAFLASMSVAAREPRWRERIADDPTSQLLVAVRDGRLVGYCGLAIPSRDADAAAGVAEVAAFYVDPSAWHSGAGSALMEAALTTLREQGWQLATLWVLTANARARAFYERFGFEPDGARQTHAELGIDISEIRMRLELHPAVARRPLSSAPWPAGQGADRSGACP